jgi:thioredoxin reductase
MRPSEADVLVVGSGPAGLVAAIELASLRPDLRVLVIDRDTEPGGLPRHARHPGFGWGYVRRPLLTGPGFAALTLARAGALGNLSIAAGTALLSLSEGPGAAILSPEEDLTTIAPKAIILATGIREEPRGPRLIGGHRPPNGVVTSGALMRWDSAGLARPFPDGRGGQRAVIVGTGLSAFSAWLTARRLGLRTVAMVESQTKLQAWWWLALGRGIILPSKMLLASAIIEARSLPGAFEGALSEVLVEGPDGGETVIGCERLILTGGWRGETQVASESGLEVDPRTLSLTVDQYYRTSLPGTFGCGNALFAVRSSGGCALDGGRAAGCVAAFLSGTLPPAELALVPGAGVRDLTPRRLGQASEPGPGAENLLVGAGADQRRARLQIRSESGALLVERRLGAVKASDNMVVPLRAIRGALGASGRLTVSLSERGE